MDNNYYDKSRAKAKISYYNQNGNSNDAIFKKSSSKNCDYPQSAQEFLSNIEKVRRE